MRLHIYLVDCGREAENGEEQRETEMWEGKKWEEGRDSSCLFEGGSETWIGTPCRVRLDIYLVCYGREEEKGENRERLRETERWGREGKKGETEAASLRGRLWKLKISLPLLDRGWGSRRGLSLKGTEQTITACMCTMCMDGVPGSLRVSDALELELQFCKSRKRP